MRCEAAEGFVVLFAVREGRLVAAVLGVGFAVAAEGAPMAVRATAMAGT